MARELQGFIDESVSDEEFVLGGYIAPAAVWVQFSKDWEELLPLALRDRAGKHYFKMSEMAARRMDRVPAFYAIVDRYSELIPISCRMNLGEFASAQQRLANLARSVDWEFHLGNWTNPYFFLFRLMLD